MQSATKTFRHRSTIVLVAMLGLASGCSSDAVRFEEYLGDSLVTNSVRTPNQQSIIKRPSGKLQPFDRSPDMATRNGIRVVRQTPAKLPPAPSVVPRRTPLQTSAPKVSRSELPPVVETQPLQKVAPVNKPITTAAVQPAVQAPAVLAPRGTAPSPLRRIDEKGVVTGAVPTQTTAPVKRVSGWSAEGGSAVTLQKGETLQSLSRRFGVPVKAIAAANGLRNANETRVGQRIVIPAYSRAQPSHSATNSGAARTAARPASRATAAPTTVPTMRQASTGSQPAVTSVTTPKQRAGSTSPVPSTRTPVAVGQNGGTHTVMSGQTLYSISRKYNVRLDAMRQANRLTSDTLRVGQRLVVPADGYMASNTTKQRVDPTPTGSIPKVRETPRSATPHVATKRTPEHAERTASVEQTFRWPVSGRTIARFGASTPGGANEGINIAVPTGTPVRAARAGTVIYAGNELEDMGELVLLSHPGGFVTAYANASKTLVKRGQRVNGGDVIARSGKTGNARQPQLHFEIRKNSQPVDPLTYLPR